MKLLTCQKLRQGLSAGSDETDLNSVLVSGIIKLV